MRNFFVCFLLMLITAVVFGQVSRFEFVSLDDQMYVYENPRVKEGLNTESIKWAFLVTEAGFWHPLTWLSLMLDVDICGLNAGCFHVTNLLLHIANAGPLFLVLNGMTGAVWRSALVAALFAVHPLHVEPVAWIAARKDVLSTFFWMLTLAVYVFYVKRPGLPRYLLLLLAFALGLMAKPMLVTMPFVLLLLDFWPLGRFSLNEANGGGRMHVLDGPMRSMPKHPVFSLAWEKAPLLVLAVISIFITFVAEKKAGAISTWQTFPLSIRLENALVSYVEYIEKMFWPEDLAVFYPHPGSWPAVKVALAAFLLTAVSILVVRFVRRYPYLAVGWAWYIGTLVPVIGLVQIGVHAMADRYTYIPLIGLFIIVVWGANDLAANRRYRVPVLAASALCIVGISMALAFVQLQYWRDSITLFEHALAVTRNNYLIHSNMGASLAKRGQLGAAVAHFREALRIRPADMDARYNLSNALVRQGNLKDAVADYTEVLKHRPDDAAVHNNLAIALSILGDRAGAIAHFQEALRIRPDYEEARRDIAIALQTEKDSSEIGARVPGALPQYHAESAEGHMQIGLALVQKGKLGEAIGHFEEALRRDPQLAEAHISLGLAMAKQQQLDGAIEHFRKALQIKPGLAEAHSSLGVALAYKGKTDEAIGHFEEALRINPRFAKAHNGLGVVLARTGRVEEAISHFREALRLMPSYAEADRNLKIITDTQGKTP